MKKQIFKFEADMQVWLENEFERNKSLADLIINKDEITKYSPNSFEEKKIHNSYIHCLESLYINKIISKNENISLKSNNNKSLKPDFLLYASDTQSIIIVELKNHKNATRQAGTEISAYANEIKSYIPFISDGDVINVIISSEWPILLRHYIFHEIFWLQRNVICLEPIEKDGNIKLKIKKISSIIENEISLELCYKHLGGYQLCLYDDNLQKKIKIKNNLEVYIEQMKTAISAMATKGNSQKNHGFAFLWKDNSIESSAPYSITIINVAPFQLLERFYHNNNIEINQTTKKLINITCDFNPKGQSQSLSAITRTGEKFLKNFCKPKMEGFYTWDILEKFMIDRGTLISFHSWGIFNELFYQKLEETYIQGNTQIQNNNPELGLQILKELINPKYDFIDLSCSDFNFENFLTQQINK